MSATEKAYTVSFACAVVKMADGSRVTLMQGSPVPSDVDAEHFKHLLKLKAIAEVKPEPKAEVKPEPKAEVKPEPKAEVKPEPKSA